MEYLQADTDFDLSLIEFGLSNDLKSQMSKKHVGNELFCAPEARVYPTLKSDVFSVGAMFLHFMYPLIQWKNESYSNDDIHPTISHHIQSKFNSKDHVQNYFASILIQMLEFKKENWPTFEKIR